MSTNNVAVPVAASESPHTGVLVNALVYIMTLVNTLVYIMTLVY